MGYSLSSYPAGNGSTAVGDITFTNNIPDNVGIALFSTSNPANFDTTTLYREGAGLGNLVPFSIDSSWYRNVPSFGAGAGLPQDTGNNAADFKFVDTNGTSSGGDNDSVRLAGRTHQSGSFEYRAIDRCRLNRSGLAPERLQTSFATSLRIHRTIPRSARSQCAGALPIRPDSRSAVCAFASSI